MQKFQPYATIPSVSAGTRAPAPKDLRKVPLWWDFVFFGLMVSWKLAWIAFILRLTAALTLDLLGARTRRSQNGGNGA